MEDQLELYGLLLLLRNCVEDINQSKDFSLSKKRKIGEKVVSDIRDIYSQPRDTSYFTKKNFPEVFNFLEKIVNGLDDVGLKQKSKEVQDLVTGNYKLAKQPKPKFIEIVLKIPLNQYGQ